MIELLLQAERALAVGLLDQAERLYRQASDQDPRNAIAVVGLARVALERGDDSLALAEGRRALEIDPDNATASRLVQRLEEIALFRGRPAPATPVGEAPAAGDATSGDEAGTSEEAPAAEQAQAADVAPVPAEERTADNAPASPPRWPPPGASTPTDPHRTPITDGTLSAPPSPDAAAPATSRAPHEEPPRKRRTLLGRLLRRG